MITRKQLIFAIIIISVAGVIFITILLSGNSPKSSDIKTSSRPASRSSVTVPKGLKNEQTLQENYGQIRKQYLNENPWILSMPVQSNNFFISFDSEKEEFLVSLYYYRSSNLSREEQINQAKDEALIALKSLGLESDKIKIVYTETGRD